MQPDLDLLFKALADPTRRYLLDQLRQENGQTLGELCRRLDMTRQSATQHLAVLEAANLVSTVRRGREKLHYLNPVPLHEMQERWVGRFEEPRLRALSTLKRRAEDTMSDKPSFVYTTYIEASPERVWEALTDADLTARYWGHRNESENWQVGSRWAHVRIDGSGVEDVYGEIIEAVPPKRLVQTWRDPNGPADQAPSKVEYDLEERDGVVRLTVTHTDLFDAQAHRDVSGGWPAVLSNLKSFLERGKPMSVDPWTVG
ncbi:ArsR/SmtB family transcription factor [Amycolatopsis benzoatilytica]|uniref:ArsR/SmtB family transcription factor n=1 Tax=Amycolatopsis benzoatilytica TaxID=346045 RepID=UPI00037C12D1|nr:metalloregulator ArsR/SmtB family transcription factor [Amycolatopsis benzoatilytica]